MAIYDDFKNGIIQRKEAACMKRFNIDTYP